MHKAAFAAWLTGIFIGAVVFGCALAAAYGVSERIGLWSRRTIRIRQRGRIRWVSADELVGFFEDPAERDWL